MKGQIRSDEETMCSVEDNSGLLMAVEASAQVV
jgi:hypothetical protein